MASRRSIERLQEQAEPKETPGKAMTLVDDMVPEM